MSPRKNKISILSSFMIILLAFFLMYDNAFCGVQYQGTAEGSRKNALGGYDYYDRTGKKTGYSVKKPNGSYDYYDASGNKTGSLMKKSKSSKSYTFYNADKIRQGSLKRGATGTYSYRDVQKGTSTESASQIRKDISSLSPDTFQGKKSKAGTLERLGGGV